MSVDQNLSPMTRYALVLGSRSCPTLSAAAVCPSLDTSTAPTPHLTRPLPCSTSLHYGSSWWLETEDWPSQAILATNSGGWPATNEPRTGDVEAACPGQIDMAETHSNGHIYNKLLKKKRLSRCVDETSGLGWSPADSSRTLLKTRFFSVQQVGYRPPHCQSTGL